MNNDDIQRILADEDKITPSTGFPVSVMAAVQREATAPQPLDFPWFHALPGFLATVAAFGVALWQGIGALRDPAIVAALDEQLHQFTTFAVDIGLQWILLAVAITIISLMLSSTLGRVRNRALL